MTFKSLLGGLIALSFLAPASFAQVGEESVGTVKAVDGEVIVARGADTYTLGEGDLIFPGDRIITRSEGGVTIATADCEQLLGPTSSIVVDAQFCSKSPIQLASGDGTAPPVDQGGGITTGAAVGGISLLAAAGAAAAAGGGGGGGTPASP